MYVYKYMYVSNIKLFGCSIYKSISSCFISHIFHFISSNYITTKNIILLYMYIHVYSSSTVVIIHSYTDNTCLIPEYKMMVNGATAVVDLASWCCVVILVIF